MQYTNGHPYTTHAPLLYTLCLYTMRTHPTPVHFCIAKPSSLTAHATYDTILAMLMYSTMDTIKGYCDSLALPTIPHSMYIV